MNYKIYTANEIAEQISKEDFERIAKLGNKYRNIICNNNDITQNTHCDLNKNNEEIIYIFDKFSNKSNIEKNMIASVINFPDNENFCTFLKNNNIDLEKIKLLNNLLDNSLIESKNIKASALLELLKLKINICAKEYFNIDNVNLVINKINQLVVFYPEMLLTKKDKTDLNKIDKILTELTETISNVDELELMFYTINKNNDETEVKLNIVFNENGSGIAPQLLKISEEVESYIELINKLTNIIFDLQLTTKTYFLNELTKGNEISDTDSNNILYHKAGSDIDTYFDVNKNNKVKIKLLDILNKKH